MKILNRIETLEYIKNQITRGRLVTSRYSDGEYLMMENLSNNTHDSFEILPKLLKNSIQCKNQFVCINYLKPHNIENNDRWCTVQKYLSGLGGHNLYGCCNWNIYDFQNDNEILPSLFSKKVLIVTGHEKETKLAFKNFPQIQIFSTSKKNASSSYNEDKKKLIKICNNFDNILFACGPIGKVLLTDLIDVCDSNLIDLGALLNAIINEFSINTPLISQWDMSWVKTVNIEKQAKQFFKGVKKINGL